MTVLPISIIEHIFSFSDSIWVLQRCINDDTLVSRINKKSSFINTLERMLYFKLSNSYYLESFYSPTFKTVFHIIPDGNHHFYEYRYQINYNICRYHDLTTNKVETVYTNEKILNNVFIYRECEPTKKFIASFV
jgi:hypothetical protein